MTHDNAHPPPSTHPPAYQPTNKALMILQSGQYRARKHFERRAFGTDSPFNMWPIRINNITKLDSLMWADEWGRSYEIRFPLSAPTFRRDEDEHRRSNYFRQTTNGRVVKVFEREPTVIFLLQLSLFRPWTSADLLLLRKDHYGAAEDRQYNKLMMIFDTGSPRLKSRIKNWLHGSESFLRS